MARQLIFLLDRSTNLNIQNGLLAGASINGLTIEGPSNHIGVVEILDNAFKDNNGPFPDIKFINIANIVLHERAFKGDFKLNVTNSQEVHILKQTFRGTQLEGYFRNIQDLRISEGSFYNSSATLKFVKCNIQNLHRFEVSLREVLFEGCKIGTINAGTFDVNNIYSLIFRQCEIDVIKSKAVTEKLFGRELSITDGAIGKIESQAIHGSGITEITLLNNTIETIGANAIEVTSANATILQNRVINLEDNWLFIKHWSNVRIAHNKFYDFGAIKLEQQVDKHDCVFEENVITKAKPDSLSLNQNCRIFKISFNYTCMCDLSWLNSITKRDIRSESYCKINDQLQYCFNTTIFNVLRYEKEVCDLAKETLSCANNRNLYKVNDEFIQPKEKDHSIYKIVAIGIGSIFLLGLVVFIYGYARKRNHHEIVMSGSEGLPGHTTTVLYESREFSPEDKRIISQTLELIRKKYNRVYDNVKEKIDVLLRGNITEKERLEAIGDIIHDLENCQNPGDSFVAFTDILSRHLSPPITHQTATAPPPDPVYSEPMNVGGSTGIENIYAEPNQFQQREPLLRNDYSTPADRNVESNLYSEPVILGKEKVPPYAIADPKFISPYAHAPVIQQPSTSATTKNLPDVLSQAEPKPLTHVQQLAHNFANNPNFHINRSPLTNRRIPMYTIPNKVKPPTVASHDIATTATFNLEQFGDDYDLLGATALPLDSGSNHSGGSKETIQIDDIIHYVDE
ncbi:hypothetical protein ACFFRR_002192 [Megaselia abdita]